MDKYYYNWLLVHEKINTIHEKNSIFATLNLPDLSPGAEKIRFHLDFIADLSSLLNVVQDLFDEIEVFRNEEFYEEFNSLEKLEERVEGFSKKINNISDCIKRLPYSTDQTKIAQLIFIKTRPRCSCDTFK